MSSVRRPFVVVWVVLVVDVVVVVVEGIEIEAVAADTQLRAQQLVLLGQHTTREQ